MSNFFPKNYIFDDGAYLKRYAEDMVSDVSNPEAYREAKFPSVIYNKRLSIFLNSDEPMLYLSAKKAQTRSDSI